MAKSAFLPAALLLLASLLGCGSPVDTAKRPGGQDIAAQDPDTIVRNAVESRTALSSIAGKGVMRIVDQPSDFGLTVNADVIADENDRLRIRADKLAGAIQAFDVVMLGEDIGFYVPTQKTLFHGKVDELQDFSFRFDPDEVLQQMLRPDASLMDRKWRFAQAGNKNAIVLEEEVGGSAPRLRLAINPNTGTLAGVAQLDASGKPVFIKRYGDYRDMATGRRAVADSGDIFPYLISFSWPRDRRSMEMQFKSVDPNAPVSDADFDLAASSDTEYRPLREAAMEPGFGDDPVASRPREPTDADAL